MNRLALLVRLESMPLLVYSRFLFVPAVLRLFRVAPMSRREDKRCCAGITPRPWLIFKALRKRGRITFTALSFAKEFRAISAGRNTSTGNYPRRGLLSASDCPASE
jgi:hypothetical protein